MISQFIITKNLSGLRLDQALSYFLKSRSQAVHLIQSGYVRVDKKLNLKSDCNLQNMQKRNMELSLKKNEKTTLKPSYRVEKGDHIFLTHFEEKQEIFEPYDFHVPIVYEDRSLLVVNKPAGLVVHPGCGHQKDTLIHALIRKLDPEVGFHSKRPGLMHRLDKEVSGLLVLSKTHQAQNLLARQFLSRKIKRTYWALCYGPFRFEEGRLDTFITRHPVNRKKFISHSSKGKRSITLFKILEKKEDEMALVQFHLLTGRTHQVRIHSREFSNGIVGDAVYSSSKSIKKVKNPNLLLKISQLNRIALHAVDLTLIHPETKEIMSFHAPFPKDLQNILDDFCVE